MSLFSVYINVCWCERPVDALKHYGNHPRPQFADQRCIPCLPAVAKFRGRANVRGFCVVFIVLIVLILCYLADLATIE